MLQVRVGGETYTFEDDGSDVLVGRAATCQVRIDDARVSRTHLRITPTAAGWIVTDVQSANGSFVGGKRVTDVTCTAPTTVRLTDPTDGVEVEFTPL
jgi:pSer/pThr/pTyr-binding forkhead associated (FHA) protein